MRRVGRGYNVAMPEQMQAEIAKTFHEYVNMTSKALEAWLESDESQTVGQKKTGGESTGHEEGRHLVRLLQKRPGEYDDRDYAEMQRVVGYIKRHLAQRPDKADVEHTRWAYSLRNWGHDPTRD